MRETLRAWGEWVVPSAPTADARINARIERTLLAQAIHLNNVIALLSPPSAAIWVVLLWGRSDRRALLVWFGLVVLSSLVMAAATATYDKGHDSVKEGTGRLGGALVVTGVVWGSIAWLWMPFDPTWKPLVGMLVVGPMAANAIFTAAVPRLFWSFQLSAVAVAVTGLITDPHPATRSTVFIILYALPFSGLLSKIKGSSDQQAAYYAATAEQIAEELKVTNADLAHQASHDPLTGLANRKTLTNELAQAVAAGENVGVLLIDLDHFKVINDSLGHAAGDEVLCRAGERVTGALRQEDLLARFGGDEFTVLARQVECIADLRSMAERVLHAFAAPLEIDGRHHQVNASIGAALIETGHGPADLFRAADAALYDAKRLGRATYRLFDDSLRSRIALRTEAEQGLRAALDVGEIVGWCQPIVDLRTGALAGAEGLARWVSRTDQGEREVRVAADFLALVDDTRLQVDVTRAVGRNLLSLQREVLALGHSVNLGLNVPPGNLNQLLDRILEEGDLTGLTLEITERGIIADPADAHRRLSAARARGAEVWLDDFGTGQSSLSLLTQLPLDGVKIDRSFVKVMGAHREARTVVVAIIEMAQTLGLRVVAEGVETVEQAEDLRSMGVGLAQGFLFSPAIPPDEFRAMVVGRHDWAIELGLPRPSGTVPGWSSKSSP